MTDLIKTACDYLSEAYDMEYEEKGKLLFVHNNDSRFKVNLSDRESFRCYTLYHQNYVKNDLGWHVQLKSKSVFRILLTVFGHDFYKYNGIFITVEDVKRLQQDVIKMCRYEA